MDRYHRIMKYHIHEYHRIDEDEKFRVITLDLQPLLDEIRRNFF